MKRREFVSLFAGAAAWPLSARAQQQQPMPVVGFLGSGSPDRYVPFVTAFRQGLKETGYMEDANVAITFAWPQGDYNRLPGLAADLVNRRVAVIAAGGPPVARAAKTATSAIPIVFTSGDDPVEIGLVDSVKDPGGHYRRASLFQRVGRQEARVTA